MPRIILRTQLQERVNGQEGPRKSLHWDHQEDQEEKIMSCICLVIKLQIKIIFLCFNCLFPFDWQRIWVPTVQHGHGHSWTCSMVMDMQHGH